MRDSSEDRSLLSQGSSSGGDFRKLAPQWVRPRFQKVLVALFIISMGVNILTGMQYVLYTTKDVSANLQHSTPFAHLEWNILRTFDHHNAYDSSNESSRNDAWASINYDRGSIALTDEYADSLGLPRAQRFPWDEDKGLFFLNAHHSLHCLVILYSVMHELRDSRPLSYTFGHALHCLDTLRQDVICFADDTPRYTSELHPGQSGTGQTRQCRDWDALEAWSLEHTSCWRDIQPNNSEIDTLIRFKFCPPGSPYLEQIHAVFGDFDSDDAGPLID
ncbi:hypothetical protein NHQ30_001544 [Ciborinia camelliae]|nr:hypothetical protein NHQ30_001544 [Ciborinia camelliae]